MTPKNFARKSAASLGRLERSNASVAHVAKQRCLFLVDQLGQPFHQLGFLHLVGNLGDYDLVGATARLLLLPACAQAEAAAACLVRFQDLIARLHDDPARREVRLRAMSPGRDLVEVKEATLGARSGILGAAALARDPSSGEYVLGT